MKDKISRIIICGFLAFVAIILLFTAIILAINLFKIGVLSPLAPMYLVFIIMCAGIACAMSILAATVYDD